MPDTATLAQYIGASTVRKVDGEANTYELDGTKYIVPDYVLAAAETVKSGEGIRGRNVSTNPTPSDLGASKELLQWTPTTLYVDGTPGWSKGGERWTVPSREGAESMAESLRSAEQTAAEHYPEYWEETFGADYSVEVVGAGLYKEEMFDGVDVPEPPNSSPRNSFKDDLTGSVVERILLEHRPDSQELRISSLSSPRGNGLIFHGPDLSEARSLAEDVAAAYEEALTNLKNQYPDNWQEWYGYTSVPVVEE